MKGSVEMYVISAAVPNVTASALPAYCRSRTSVRESDRSWRNLGGVRRLGGSVSGRNHPATSSTRPTAASTPNTPRQLVTRST